MKIEVGDIVRQYTSPARVTYTDAQVLYVHGNGALDVVVDGVRYGWSENQCELVRKTEKD